MERDRLVTELRADTAGMRRDLQENERDVESWGRRVTAVVGGAIATFGAISLADEIVEATRIEQRALGQLRQGLITTNNAVKLSYDEIVQSAENLQDVSTFASADIIKAQSQLITFTQITGDEFIRTTEVAADLAVRFDGDLKGAVIQLGKALNDPITNLSALADAGIQFSEDQKAMIAALIESGNLAAAQRVILKELEVQFGGSARAARNDFGGALEGLSNAAASLLAADNLGGVVDDIESLTAALRDPETVKAAGILTSAIIQGMGKAAKAIAVTINSVNSLGESIAAAIHGPALGDLERLNTALEVAQFKLQQIESGQATDIFGRAKKRLREEIASLEERIKLSKELGALNRKNDEGGPIDVPLGASAAPINNAPDEISVPDVVPPEFEKIEASLKRQIDLFGETSKAAQLRYDLENGLIEGLDKNQIDKLVSQQQRLDEMTAKEIELRENAAEEIRRIDEDQRGRDSLAQNVALLEEQLMTEEERILAAHERRQEMLDNALEQRILSEERYKEISLKLEREADAERRQIATKGFGVLLSIADRYYDGVTTKEAQRVRAAIQLGTVLLDKEKRDSLKRIAINTRDAAMGAYSALASIPYVGPFLGAAAAGSVIALGGAYAADVAGIAHGGLDNVPKESTYLLDKGERVLSPRQNQDLTSFLDDNNAGRQQGDVTVIVNEAPGVQNDISYSQQNGKTVVTIDQKIREITRDEMLIQSAPGGLLDKTYMV
ncbi:hypothetical protein [Agarilytica rhodophyticola]|uniref:hypothetical protein n=1 Tax=Agarilytica rhodophyticola TaxID=1737490 RepID=UPI000B3458CF|nr:hypothetical protein [Agarilytica rhodophyticola]